jgi:uroporphyrinogen decarboxylase
MNTLRGAGHISSRKKDEFKVIPRERVLRTLNHREPDCIPVDLGATVLTGIHKDAYRALAGLLDVKLEMEIDNIMEQVAMVEPAFLDAAGIEKNFVRIDLNPPSGWVLEIKEEEGHSFYYDEWGIRWGMPASGFYYDMIEHPLAKCENVSDIDRYAWPRGGDPARFEGLEFEAKALRQTPYAIIGSGRIGAGVLEQCCWMRGTERYFEDIILNKVFSRRLAEKITEIQIESLKSFLQKTGPFIDVLTLGDDWCGQEGPLVSPVFLREVIIPLTKMQIELIRRYTDAKIFFHSCGSVVKLIPDMIDMGIDILNPVQITAKGMDPRVLKEQFGKDLVFWGGVDTQKTLPFSTSQEVRKHTESLIRILAPGGGFVFSTNHNIQSGTPPENLMAMYRTVSKHGAYE